MLLNYFQMYLNLLHTPFSSSFDAVVFPVLGKGFPTFWSYPETAAKLHILSFMYIRICIVVYTHTTHLNKLFFIVFHPFAPVALKRKLCSIPSYHFESVLMLLYNQHKNQDYWTRVVGILLNYCNCPSKSHMW